MQVKVTNCSRKPFVRLWSMYFYSSTISNASLFDFAPRISMTVLNVGYFSVPAQSSKTSNGLLSRKQRFENSFPYYGFSAVFSELAFFLEYQWHFLVRNLVLRYLCGWLKNQSWLKIWLNYNAKLLSEIDGKNWRMFRGFAINGKGSIICISNKYFWLFSTKLWSNTKDVP